VLQPVVLVYFRIPIHPLANSAPMTATLVILRGYVNPVIKQLISENLILPPAGVFLWTTTMKVIIQLLSPVQNSVQHALLKIGAPHASLLTT